ncbi:MAG: hypothetical protein OEY43_09365, partial [Gammaproteobacteria bacterium]|nr:hypothetical protein [Gammaproteobacteria bacterium]
PEPEPEPEPEPMSSKNDLMDYFESELGSTNEYIFKQDTDNLTTDQAITNMLFKLRSDYLGIEKDRAREFPKTIDIEVLENSLYNMLSRHKIIHALKLIYNKEDKVDYEYKLVIDRQEKHIDFLKDYANNVLAKILAQNKSLLELERVTKGEDSDGQCEAHDAVEEQTENMFRQLEGLEANNTELTQCIAILEDENEFLRAQINALLKVGD